MEEAAFLFMLVTLLQALPLVHAAEGVVFEPGARLVTGCRNGHLKIRSYNKWCLPALKREGKHYEICDCTYAEMNRSNSFCQWSRVTCTVKTFPSHEQSVCRGPRKTNLFWQWPNQPLPCWSLRSRTQQMSSIMLRNLSSLTG